MHRYYADRRSFSDRLWIAFFWLSTIAFSWLVFGFFLRFIYAFLTYGWVLGGFLWR